jgi:hypothetical protein
VLTLAVTLVAGGETRSQVVVPPAPAGFVIGAGLADPLCNGGRGVRLHAALGDDPVVGSGTLADGSTLIAFSELYPGKDFAVIQSVTRECVPNGDFGNAGAATIAIPERLRPRHVPPGVFVVDGLWITEVAARTGGGAIVAGTFRGGWVIGEVTPNGQLDPAFGDGGWTVLRYTGEVTEVLQEPSGRILIAGDNGGGGCCTRNFAAALSPRGQLERGFGRHGRTELPTGTDSGVAGLALEPNGDILATVGYGNNGCWGFAPAMLTPSGRHVPGFGRRLNRFWRGLGFGAFVGDVLVGRHGFTVVGTGQEPCAKFRSAPSGTGVIARFRIDGAPTGRTLRFRSPMEAGVAAYRRGREILVLSSPLTLAEASPVTVTARRADGSVDPRFGGRGRARIGAPWKGVLSGELSIAEAGPRTLVVIAMRSERRQLDVTRVRF